jgi:hypothetical protein
MDRLFPATHLLQAARRWLFSTQKRYHETLDFAMKLLKAAGCEESMWLLARLHSTKRLFHTTKYRWIHDAMIGDYSARANYYRGRALRLMDYMHDALSLLSSSAEAGFAPAMIEMSNFGDLDWLGKAANLGDPTALFKLGQFEGAAANGHILSYKILSEKLAHHFSTTEVATFRARYVLLSRDVDYVGKGCYWSVPEKYVMGRELYGYEVIWGPKHKLNPKYRTCIRIYLDITERARRAALQTTFGLRAILGKDIARMIGKMVYEMRITL